MDIGMLWFDSDSNRDVSVRIKQASKYYRSKYGREPNLCYVHPSTGGTGIPKIVGELKVITSQTVLPDHFWLGIEKAEASEPRSMFAA